MEMFTIKIYPYHLASSLVLLAFLFGFHSVFAQKTKILEKFASKNTSYISGYVEYEEKEKGFSEDDTVHSLVMLYFYRTKENLNYYIEKHNKYNNLFYCRLGKSGISKCKYEIKSYETYYLTPKIDVYNETENITFPQLYISDILLSETKNYMDSIVFIPSVLSKDHYRFRLTYPKRPNLIMDSDYDLGDIISGHVNYVEFDKKTMRIQQIENEVSYMKIQKQYNSIEVLNQNLYQDIKTFIIDTVQNAFDRLKEENEHYQTKKLYYKDSILRQYLCDSISNIYVNQYNTVVQKLPLEKDSIRYAPYWKLPLISGDTLYSDSIQSRFVLIDFWYIHCAPCMLAMSKLPALDTIFGNNILQIVSINLYDKDIANIEKTVHFHHLKNAVAYNGEKVYQQFAVENGVPQFFIIDTQTNEIIWEQAGYYAKLVEDIEKIIKANL